MGRLPPILDRVRRHPERTAVVDESRELRYDELLELARRAAALLLDGRFDLAGERVAFLVAPGADHVAWQWGIWAAGGIAVPLCTAHPAPELAHVLDDAGASILIASEDFADRLAPLAAERGARLLVGAPPSDGEPASLPDVGPERPAMLVYTSGTTGRPKGAISSHATIAAQICAMVEAWEWSPEDRILGVLPLHHVHGIVNVVATALWTGATCELVPRFDAERVWERFADPRALTLFMAVPTIYHRLIAAWEAAPPEQREAWSAGCRRLRLMVSGSAALPVTTLERWRGISGHTLLERYGMTELGMALTNPLRGDRRPGFVGAPFPDVEVELRDEAGSPVAEGEPGELHVRGPNVFDGYWGRPEETAEALTEDGWFRTGDVAVLDSDSYRILGRASVDIVKTGGYKVSALEIEEVLRTHPAVAEVAVVGVADEEWGERVAAAVVVRDGEGLELEELRDWGKERLAAYKVPSRLAVVAELPRNPIGKVLKPAVAGLFGSA